MLKGRKYFLMTKKELERREKAACYAFKDGNFDKAFEYILQLIDINSKNIVFRFRRPELYEIETLNEKKIFLCRPFLYEDNGDCKILFNNTELYRYLMLEMKADKYEKVKGIISPEFDKIMEKAIDENPKMIELKEKIRNEALIACMTENYSDYMWKNYAKNFEGICLIYNLREVILSFKEEFGYRIFPVRYVDDREKQEDIRFGVNEYGKSDDCYENETKKYILSCLTKDKIPYSKEAEWRIFSEYEELPKDAKGKKFDFVVKPKGIIMGKNISINPEFEESVNKYSKSEGVKLFTQIDSDSCLKYLN